MAPNDFHAAALSGSGSQNAWALEPTVRGTAMVAGATPAPYWLDRPLRPAARPRLIGQHSADLVVVGGGFTGLWAAVQAAEANPERSVVLLEGDRIAEGASGRNGGFCSASLTHGLVNGMERYGDELPDLLRMGVETLEAIAEAVVRLGIDADVERTGELDLASFDWQVPGLKEFVEQAHRLDQPLRFLDGAELTKHLRSPMAHGAVYDPDVMMIDPAKLAWGLAAAAERLGVRVFEHSKVTSLTSVGDRVAVATGYGSVDAARVVVATSASKPLRRRLGYLMVPVWDYAIMTEPLSERQLSAIGWSGRQGLADSGNRFHYFRLTADNRILFGGWDAVYYYGGDTDPRLAQKPSEFGLLAEHLLQVFPQLEGITATHTWGGVIDTCSRFNNFWDVGLGGKVVSVLGFTGLGVGAAHFGAATALDLIDGKDTERTRLKMVQSKPIPFPPEPLRWFGITLTRREFARADRNQGRRGLWLKAMDAVGLGFDS